MSADRLKIIPRAASTPQDTDLAAFWMPFTDNRYFKSTPRLLASASGMHYFTPEGRKILDEHKGCASEEAAATLQQAANELKLQGDSIAAELRSSVDTLSATLASRVLGVSQTSIVTSESATTAPGR